MDVSHLEVNTTEPNGTVLKEKKKKEKAFVFENYPHRKIVLRLAYHGHVHDGFATQESLSGAPEPSSSPPAPAPAAPHAQKRRAMASDRGNTVEGLLVEALRKVKLVCPQRGPQDVGRCGRTDKGVSALGNAYSFIARASCWPSPEEGYDGEGPPTAATATASTSPPPPPPLDYPSLLNHVLPSTIRVTGFALVRKNFNARFNCRHRTYRYYFCHAHLQLDKMREAIAHFMGEHCFRSFCKLDVVNVHNFTRTVFSIKIEKSSFLPEAVSYLEVNANSFLYHQIRCIMEVLFLVGRGLESPSVVCDLLRRADAKPNYPLADGIPLILWDCAFDRVDLPRWETSRKSFNFLERELQDICVALLLRATMMAEMRSAIYHSYHTGEEDTETEKRVTEVVHPQERVRSAFSALDHTLPPAETALSGQKRPRRVVPTYAHQHVFENTSATGAEDHMQGRFIDNWSITGCDWTEPRSIENKSHRRYELFNFIKFEEALESQQTDADAVKGGGEKRVYVPANYVPLLERETERSYDEEVTLLTGKKKERYESNMEKKIRGEALWRREEERK